MAAAANEDEDAHVDEEVQCEPAPEASGPASRTSSRAGSGQRTVTQEVLFTVTDISGVGYELTPKSTASRKFPEQFFSEIAAAVLDGDTGELLEYRHLMKNPKYKAIWGNSFRNEVGRLAQGMPGRISKEKATNTMFFIAQDDIPPDRRRDVTYAKVVCNYRDQKKEKERR